MNLEHNIINTYLSAIEIVEHVESLFCGSEQIHYSTIQKELKSCCDKIDIIIAWETEHCDFLVALFQQKQQLTMLINLIENVMQEEVLINKCFNIASPINCQTSFIQPQIVESEIGKLDKNDKLLHIVQSSMEIPKVSGLSEIIGLLGVKMILRSLVILPKTQPQLFYNHRICNSILFYGPPGTGKTRLAHALAAEAKATFYCISASDVLSHYVGQTEKTIKMFFQYLKRSCHFTILFIDEIDAFCRKRTASEQEHTRRIKTEFMCQMSSTEECKNMYTVCATNCPWDLDTAILRRFQKRIYIPLPNENERFEFFTKNVQFHDGFVDWTPLLKKTEGYSGSDLLDLIQNALNIPLHELEDTKIWKHTEEGFYEPVLGEQDFSNVICSELSDLPPNSVKARKLQMNDLLNAVDTVMRTVTQSDVKKYERFCGI